MSTVKRHHPKSMEVERGPVCGIDNCRSTTYVQGDDGYTYCSNGHQVEARIETQNEAIREIALAGSRTTRRKVEIAETEATLLRGREGVKLYLQCFQYVLRRQTSWLVRTKGYPKELEVGRRRLLLKMELSLADNASPCRLSSTTSGASVYNS